MQNSGKTLIKSKVIKRPNRQTVQKQPIQSIQLQVTDASMHVKGGLRHSTAFGFQRANYQLAMETKIKNSNRYYKGEEIGLGVDNQHFKIYGPGIYLFFQFLKKLSILFLVLTVISLVPIIYNYVVGGRFSQATPTLSIYISQVSIANFYGNDPSKSAQSQISNTKIPKLVNCISDLTICFTVMVFYFYWTNKSGKQTQQLKKTIKLANYFTIQLVDFPKNLKDHEIYNFFSKFGMVTEVAAVKNYSQSINLSKQIYDYEVTIKELKIENQTNPSNNYNQKAKDIQKKIQKLYKELAQQQQNTKDQVIKYYISFQTPLDRANVVRKFNKVYKWYSFCSNIPDQYKINGNKIKIQPCHNQPGEILWENVHITWKTRWIRALIQMILLLLFVFLGFFIISTLNILSPPSNVDSINTSSYTSTSILLQSDTKIVQSWCLKNTAISTSTTSLSNLCKEYINRKQYKSLITYSITIVIILVKTLLKTLVIMISKFQRYKQQTQQSTDIVKNLVILYIITTVIIGFLLQAQLFGIKFKNIIPRLIGNQTLMDNANQLRDYSELNNQWYIDIGYQIWVTWLIMAISPHTYMPLLHYFTECCNQYSAKGQLLQKNMEKALHAQDFPIEDTYANIITLFFMGLAFSGGMPIILVLCFIGLATRYYYFKFYFIRFCRVPSTIDESLNHTVLSYIPWALGVHFTLTLWMYSVPSIFAFEQSWFSGWYANSSNSLIGFLSQLIAIAITSYYYFIAAGIMMLAIMFKQVIYDFFVMLGGQEDQLEQLQKEDSANDFMQKMRSQRALTDSYRIENNPNYFQILSIREKMSKRHGEADMLVDQMKD